MSTIERLSAGAVWVCACLMTPVLSTPAHAAVDSVVATVDGDVFVYDDSSPSDVVGNDTSVDFGPTAGVGVGYGILEFDFSFVDQTDLIVVLTATLTGRFDAVRVADSDVDYYGYLGDLTLDAGDAGMGTAVVGSHIDANAGTFSIPIDTTFVEGILNQTAVSPVVGLRAVVTEGTTFRMEATEWPSGVDPPTLTINYVPEPGSLALLCIGVTLLRTRRAGR